jgi:site-specific DNA recombinase
VCARCGYAYYGKQISPSGRKYHPRSYAYYRCVGADAYRFGGVRLCWNKQLRTDLVDEAVWEEVCRLLSHPERLGQDYRRRLVQEEKPPDELGGLEARVGPLRQGIAQQCSSGYPTLSLGGVTTIMIEASPRWGKPPVRVSYL